MLEHPQIDPRFRAEGIPPDIVFWLTEDQTFLVQDRLCVQLIPYLDGTFSLEQITTELEGAFSPEEIIFTLLELEGRGYLQEADRSDQRIGDLSSGLPSPTASLSFRIQLQISAASQTDPRISTLISMLHQRLGAAIGSGSTDPDTLDLVITDDYLRPDLETINRRSLETGRPWLLAKLVGKRLWLGPIFMPGRTACWHCLADRLQANRIVESFLQHHHSAPLYRPWQFQISTSTLAIEWLIQSLHLWDRKRLMDPHNHPLWNHLLIWDPETLQTEHHPLTQRPQCPACGDPTLRDPHRPPQSIDLIQFSSMPPTSLTAEQILEHYQHHCDPYVGVIQQIQTLPPIAHPLIHNTRIVHPFVRRGSLESLQKTLQGISRGKGRSATEAQAKGICEALERYSGLFQGDEIRRQARYSDLGSLAIHPNDSLLFSSHQYQQRDQLNEQIPDPRHQIPEPLDPDQSIEWTPLWSITEGIVKYLPTAYCYYGYPDQRYGQADSNGCAAGSRLDDAILNGFLELVERDGIALWWYNRLLKPTIELTSIDEPYVQALHLDYLTHGWDLWALDLTTDLQIPICAAIAVPQDRDHPGFICGFGAHFDPLQALIQALTELNQIRVTIPDPFPVPSSSDPHQPWWQIVRATDLPWLSPDPNHPAQPLPDQANIPPQDRLSISIDRARKQGLEVLVLDQTRPDLGLPVARVVVPGLRHFWRRLGSGRLYTVPVELGWLSAPLSEDQINPYSLSF